jgi:hypothetical protein
VSLETGMGVYEEPGRGLRTKPGGQKQRLHAVEKRGGAWWVRVETQRSSGKKVASDEYAEPSPAKIAMLTAGLSLGGQPRPQALSSAAPPVAASAASAPASANVATAAAAAEREAAATGSRGTGASRPEAKAASVEAPPSSSAPNAPQ